MWRGPILTPKSLACHYMVVVVVLSFWPFWWLHLRAWNLYFFWFYCRIFFNNFWGNIFVPFFWPKMSCKWSLVRTLINHLSEKFAIIGACLGHPYFSLTHKKRSPKHFCAPTFLAWQLCRERIINIFSRFYNASKKLPNCSRKCGIENSPFHVILQHLRVLENCIEGTTT